MTPERRLLARLWALMQRAKTCQCCVSPNDSFYDQHEREWRKLDREIGELLAPRKAALN